MIPTRTIYLLFQVWARISCSMQIPERRRASLAVSLGDQLLQIDLRLEDVVLLLFSCGFPLNRQCAGIVYLFQLLQHSREVDLSCSDDHFLAQVSWICRK